MLMLSFISVGTVALQSSTLFLPTLIIEMGQWTTVQTQLMTVPPYIAAFVIIINCFTQFRLVSNLFLY